MEMETGKVTSWAKRLFDNYRFPLKRPLNFPALSQHNTASQLPAVLRAMAESSGVFPLRRIDYRGTENNGRYRYKYRFADLRDKSASGGSQSGGRRGCWWYLVQALKEQGGRKNIYGGSMEQFYSGIWKPVSF